MRTEKVPCDNSRAPSALIEDQVFAPGAPPSKACHAHLHVGSSRGSRTPSRSGSDRRPGVAPPPQPCSPISQNAMSASSCAPAGYPSMHAYCVHELRMSEDVASKRIHAARAARNFPAIFAAVADGRLHLSGVCLLAPTCGPRTRTGCSQLRLTKPCPRSSSRSPGASRARSRWRWCNQSRVVGRSMPRGMLSREVHQRPSVSGRSTVNMPRGILHSPRPARP